ncbi:hypothetical protein GCM10009714_14990 [Microlunatus capsulatus]
MAKENRGSNKSRDSQKASADRRREAEQKPSKVFTDKSTPHMDGRGQSGQQKRR